MPAVEVLTTKEVEALFREEIEGVEVTDEVRWIHASLALLGLVEPGELSSDAEVQVSTEGLLGFYSSSANALVVIESDDFDYSGVQANTTLGHEFLHALQHADFDLGEYREDLDEGYDAQLAGTTLIEGEASLFERFFEAELEGIDPDRVNWPLFYDELTDAADELSKNEPGPETTASLVFPYTYGAHSAFDLWQQAGRVSLDEARNLKRPTTLADLGRRHDPSVVDVRAQKSVQVEPPNGFEALGSDQMGSWLVHGFLTHALDAQETPDLSLEWRADSLNLYGSSEASALIWQIVWENAETARFVANAVNEGRPPGPGLWGADPRGTSTWIYGVSSGAERLLALEAASRGEIYVAPADSADAGAQGSDAGVSSARYDQAQGQDALRAFLKQRQHSCFLD